MQLSERVRSSLSGACYTLAAVWAVAGTFKLIFGIRITFPLLPPVDLERVAAVPSLATAVALIATGAWLSRTARPRARDEAPVALQSGQVTEVLAAPTPPAAFGHPRGPAHLDTSRRSG